MCLFSARNLTWLAAERHKGDMFWITYSTVCSSGCSNCRQFVVGSPWPVHFSTVFQPALDQHQHFRGSNICFTVSKIINIPWHSAFLNHYFNSADYHGNSERVDLVYQPHTNRLKYRLHTNHILTTHQLACGQAISHQVVVISNPWWETAVSAGYTPTTYRPKYRLILLRPHTAQINLFTITDYPLLNSCCFSCTCHASLTHHPGQSSQTSLSVPPNGSIFQQRQPP